MVDAFRAGAAETTSAAAQTLTKHLYGPLLKSFKFHRPRPDAYFVGPNFGTLSFDWENEVVTAAARDTSGSEALALRVKSCPYRGDAHAHGVASCHARVEATPEPGAGKGEL